MMILIDNDVVIANSDVIEFGFYEGENKYKIGEAEKLYYIGIDTDRCQIKEVTSLPEAFENFKYKYVKDKFVLDETWVAPVPIEV